ncbi:hypothetical protein BDV96DRAFT_692962 [Lophiotrema nucula]|uniref:Short-chain dehydrogenases/reductase n=1 Tax=Lophiotrema nucula TaxID=690887 RepID=A0A6A5YLL7_9PLEO|nr:hypothetical protein BDV96DRAFT_692962 [Lophiotrema nucula]
MVRFSAIKQSNAAFAKQDVSNTRGLVVVLAGATSNLGQGTLMQLAAMLDGSTFYVLGRSATRFAGQLAKLEGLNPNLRVVFIETDVSLLSGIDSACQRIVAAEKKVDYLFMSQGCIPLTVPKYTKEGLDTCFALSYFSRIRLIVNLLPLLRQSPRPRVLSVLNGGREKAIREDDLGLEDARHYAPRPAINHTTLMMTLALELLASNDKQITFMHAFPGLVATDNFSRLSAPESYGLIGRLILPLVARFISTMQWLFGMSAADCGARQAFLLTSDKYGPGVAWRIDQKSESVTKAGVLDAYREQGWRDKVWDYTMRIFEKALATGS